MKDMKSLFEDVVKDANKYWKLRTELRDKKQSRHCLSSEEIENILIEVNNI